MKIKKNKLFLRILLLGLPLSSHASLESYLDIPVTDNINLFPSIEVNFKHDDNIFLAEDRLVDIGDGQLVNPVRSSFITEISPAIIFKGKKGLHNWDVGYKGEYGWYENSRNDNYDDHLLTSNLLLVANSRHKLALGLDTLFLHENRGSGISDGAASGQATFSREPDTYRDIILNSLYTFGKEETKGKIEISANFLDKNYTNNHERTDFFDRQDADIGGTFYYRISPKTSLLFLAQLTDIGYDKEANNALGTLDSTEQRYEAGISWKSTQKAELRATLGQTYKEFSSNLRPDSRFITWEVNAFFKPKTYSIINLKINSQPTETNGNSDFIKSHLYLLDWQHNWTSKTSTHLATSLTDEDYISAISRKDTSISFLAGINYKPVKTIQFGLSYERSQRDSNANGFDYTDNQFLFTSRLGL